MNPAVLETFQKYRSALRPVNCLISQDFHIEKRVASDELRANQAGLAQRSPLAAFPQQNASSSRSCAGKLWLFPTTNSQQPMTGLARRKISIRKRSFGGLATNAQTLREALSANVKPRGRGQFQLNS